MRLVLDTDAFCKLAVGGVLDDALALFGVDLQECGRLVALPHMLRRGRVRRAYGAEACDALIPVAETMPPVAQPGDTWLDQLTRVAAIDPGEALILPGAAETGLDVVTGDKRALRALKDVAGFAEALAGRIVVLEAILVALCERVGPDDLRARLHKLTGIDKMVQVCFSTGNPEPRDALLSYYESFAAEVVPLRLWHPRPGG